MEGGPVCDKELLRAVVLGVGNILLRDEGVGVHVVRELERLGVPKGVELVDGGTAGFGLASTMTSARVLIVIDAIDSEGAPGSVLRLAPEDLPRNQPSWAHQTGVLEVLDLAAAEGSRPMTVIFGVIPGSVEWGSELTPEVAAAVRTVADLVLQELSGLC